MEVYIMKKFFIFFILAANLFLASCTSSLKVSANAMAGIAKALENKIQQQTDLRADLAKGTMNGSLSEKKIAAMERQLERLDEEITHLRMRLEYSESYGYGWSRGYKSEVVIDFNPNQQRRHIWSSPREVATSWTLSDSRVGGTITIHKLKNGHFVSDKTPKQWYRIQDLLITNFSSVNSRNVNELMRKLKSLK